jgi:hypothetical protein
MAERLMQRLVNGGRTGVFLAAIIVTLLALAVPGWGGALLVLAIVVLMSAILRKTWPVQAPKTRVVRVAILALLVYLAYHKVSR